MALRLPILRKTLPNTFSIIRNLSAQSGSGPSSAGNAPQQATKPTPQKPAGIPSVPGLSSNIVRPTTGPVGPGASTTGEYKVPEYFCFNNTSYYEAEIEMAQFRCPQPVAK